jgi:hypothetical protein
VSRRRSPVLPIGVALVARVSAAAADHGGGSGAGAPSPLTSALVVGGLALLVGLIVVAIVAALTRRPDEASETSSGTDE